MGIDSISGGGNRRQMNKFINSLVTDIRAFDKMLELDMFEKNIQRIGAEQEVGLIDHTGRPFPVSMELLKKLNDDHFTTEIAQFNLEINLDPIDFKNNCLTKMEKQLSKYLNKIDKAISEYDGTPILVGIIPTIRRSDINNKYLTPLNRYKVLNDVLNKARGGPFEFRIMGMDELITKHDSIVFEGCNTSFQIHFQIDPRDAVRLYNWAHAIAAPSLASAVNSPMLLGKRLWMETRIAVFYQTVDTRRDTDFRQERSRVTFGNKWVKDSIAEVYQESITRHRVLITTDVEEDSLLSLKNGKIPSFDALTAHNGTVYHWNRLCYGKMGEKPGLRIENRMLPSGPTVVDEVANAAFWYGLMNGQPEEYYKFTDNTRFSQVRDNFYRAARLGLECKMNWIDGKSYIASDLILNELLHISKAGLKAANIDSDDILKYLDVVEDRVRSKKTGSAWIINSFSKLKETSAEYEAALAVTKGIVSRQKKNIPVHLWDEPEIKEAGDWQERYLRVDQLMISDLITAKKDDPVSLALKIMLWNHIRYIPIEDDDHKLVGLLTARSVLKKYITDKNFEKKKTKIKEIMIKDPVFTTTKAFSIDALNLLKSSGYGSLPVVKDDILVGLITERNYCGISPQLLIDILNRKNNESK